MNTESPKDKETSTVMSVGERLRQARESMGLSQQTIAERLCLRLSTVRELEEDRTPSDLAPTFLHGYIRSYAKLVQLPAEELLPMLSKQTPAKMVRVAPIKNTLLGKQRKKRDGWLMTFTWLVLFVVIGLTAAWWWQNHQANQEDIINMANEPSAPSSAQQEGQTISLSNQNSDHSEPAAAQNVVTSNAAGPATGNLNDAVQAQVAQNNATQNNVTQRDVAQNNTVVAPSQASANDIGGTANTEASQPAATVSNSNGIVLNFNGDCWLEIRDSTGKVLFSGMQRSGGSLDLSGTAPYKVKIGAPAAVQMQYQGKPVDLSRFVKSGLVARFTLGAE